MSTLQELFNKAKGVQATDLWDLCAAAEYTPDAYPPGYISHRKDGDYRKEGREWVKIPDNKGTAPEEMQTGSHFRVKKPHKVWMGGPEAEEHWTLVVGDEVTDRDLIAEGHGIRNIESVKKRAERLYGIKGTQTTDWKKAKGIAQVTNNDKVYTLEIHWYEIKGHGKIFYKEKFEESE